MLNWLRNLKRGEKYDLSSIMGRAEPDGSFSERVQWLEQLVEWLRSENQATRVKFLLQVLERNPEWKQKMGELMASLLSDAKLARLFSETGVSASMSINHEFLNRFIRVFLPRFSDDQEKSGKDGFAQIFYDDRDSVWVKALPAETWAELSAVIAPFLMSAEIREKLFQELTEASLILSMKIGSIMVREDFAARSPELSIVKSHPALNLQLELMNMQSGNINLKAIESSLAQIESVSKTVRTHLERYGVSIDLVYQRERLKQYVVRIHFLVQAAHALDVPSADRSILALFLELVEGSALDQDFTTLVRKNIALASKKVVDFTGSTGEHYIARTPAEMKKIFWGAVGGGALTAFTVYGKYLMDRSGWPMFLDFFYVSMLYAISFLVIHFLHFTLATKQPSMTAAALANKIHTRNHSGKDDEEFALEIRRLIRSQLSSIVGNIISVIPAAILLDQIWIHTSGHHFFTEHEAEHMLQSISPWRSLTFIYGIMTGCLLWLGGISSGWMENAAVYYRIPKLIENHKVLRKVLGVKITTALSRSFLKNVAGVTSSVSLGFLFGAWPQLGKFFGLPFDIRHVTLSTGGVAAAICGLGAASLSWVQWGEVVLGIALIGTLNLSVSFLLALGVAIRAKDISYRRAFAILRHVKRASV